jgi:bifunctional non-homologous end joining protein LigD
MAPRKLSLYQAKRDFTKTDEPSGKARVKPAEYPRFVIQKHAASRLHFDLRLEVGGVFKSWAVTKGPSLDPRDRRLAVETEDHPLDYGDFEGTIPKGEYGGGTVMLWDRGFWSPDEGGNPEHALHKGELKFSIAGEKLQGSWVIVRLKHDREGGRSGRNNWLLIKHRDGYEREGAPVISDQDRSVASGRTMEEIAAGKGRPPKPFMLAGKAGRANAVWHSNRTEDRDTRAKVRSASASTETPVRRASAMPRFIEPQLCKSVERPPADDRWMHEVKLDGYRMQLRVESGRATMRTRKGLDWTSDFSAIATAADELPDCIVDGEVTALDESSAPDFSALQAALSEGRSKDLIYFAFDLLYCEGEDLRSRPLIERKERLKHLLDQHPRVGKFIKFLEHLPGPGAAVFDSACRLNLEGIISKRSDASYRSGRTETWLKIKCRGGQEVVVGGWSGSSNNLRSLLVGLYEGDHLVHAGRVGTGFNQRNSGQILKKLTALATYKSPFTGKGAPRKARDVTWVKPNLVAEIEFAGWTGDGMVRQASFKGLREDKPAGEVRAERAVRSGKLKTTALNKVRTDPGARLPVHNSVLGIAISNPDKTLWPAEAEAPGYSKIDLARYLAEVGPWMIEHLRGRPCSLVRTPDGINGQQFFQRHGMQGMSDLISLVTFEAERKPYVQIDRVEALVAAAQIAAVEYHPWNNQPEELATPGRLVFDLDPAPDVKFEAVIAAAKEMKARLEKHGLETFCKTTGGKGLHVVTPVSVNPNDGLGWAEAKMFAQAVCSRMAQDSPELYLVVMTKKLRAGRIFLDYLRNDRMATAVAPLSPRARPGAPVSMPLNWSQVKRGLDPQQFTMRTAPELLRKSRPWRDYHEARQPLRRAIKTFVG